MNDSPFSSSSESEPAPRYGVSDAIESIETFKGKPVNMIPGAYFRCIAVKILEAGGSKELVDTSVQQISERLQVNAEEVRLRILSAIEAKK